LRFARSDHTGDHWTYVDPDSELELVKAVFVDGIENLRHGKRKIGQCNQVMMASFFDLSKYKQIRRSISKESIYKIRLTFLLFFSDPMFSPAAAIYVLPIVFIFSTQLYLFFDNSLNKYI
jgi:hypothetical protein